MLENVASGRSLSAFAAGFRPAERARVTGKEESEAVRLVLAYSGRTLIGEVYGDDGRPLRDALVQVGWIDDID